MKMYNKKINFPLASNDRTLEDMYEMKELFYRAVGIKKWNKIKHLTPYEFLNYGFFISGIGGWTHFEGEFRLHEDGHCGNSVNHCWMCRNNAKDED